MIYVAFYFIRALLLVALPIVWLGGLYFFARQAKKRFPSGYVYAVAFSIAVAPLIWIGYGWSIFTGNCDDIKPLAQFASVDRQQSVLLRLGLGFDFGKDSNMQIGPILEHVGPVCIENEFWKPLTNPQTGETFRFERRCGRDYLRTNQLMSKYAVAMDATKDTTGLGYVLTYRVQDTARSKVVAEAREAIFGRGLLSQYIGLFSGSNNPEYLACGYVDRLPRIWRNSRVGMGHLDYETYKALDQKLFEIAVGITNAR